MTTAATLPNLPHTSSSRGVVSLHYHDQLYLSCPVCKHMIDRDHDEALTTETEQGIRWLHRDTA